MKTVKVSTNFPQWPLLQQTPESRGLWGEYQFFVNQPVEECDFWLVYDGLESPETCRCPAGGLVFFTAEPPNVRAYEDKFVRQFALVVTAHQRLGGKRRVSPPCLPWHVGRHARGDTNLFFDKDYDFLSACGPTNKTSLISVIASDKAFTSEHRYRRDFANALRSEFGARLHFYGRGLHEIEDKWDAIAPYRYHVVLENCAFPDYWTEKICDAYLGWSYPLYMGCPNLGDYFPRQAFAKLGWGAPQDAIAMIKQVLAEDPYEAVLPHIDAARRKCLDEYNLFPYFSRLCDGLRATGPKELQTIIPEAHFSAVHARRPTLFRRLAAVLARTKQ